MGHFIGSVQGTRGFVTRLGGRNTGLHTTARGWDFGVEVYLKHDERAKEDYALVVQTKGSNASHDVVQEFELRPKHGDVLKPNVKDLVMFCHDFLREFEDAADVNEANAKLVAQAKLLVGIVEEPKKTKKRAASRK